VIKGFVSTKEFEGTATKLEAFIARHTKVNVLEVGEHFEGMDAAAFWEDFKFTLRHLNDSSRCVILSDGKWVTPWSEIVAPFFKGEGRYFVGSVKIAAGVTPGRPHILSARRD
jgi:hypothetical protein